MSEIVLTNPDTFSREWSCSCTIVTAISWSYESAEVIFFLYHFLNLSTSVTIAHLSKTGVIHLRRLIAVLQMRSLLLHFVELLIGVPGGNTLVCDLDLYYCTLCFKSFFLSCCLSSAVVEYVHLYLCHNNTILVYYN